ncbi:hypothetical protein APY94_03715 [Thermococcus celericrescens]|uniref:Tyr recombinase domain-containing protein n=2 Tax=Thermococcus celericrescens TaxID=227598 RepID=A0A100XYW4_9EURY|nr:hypothetical protein APY94_03715 [Thermococcus celericrescens]
MKIFEKALTPDGSSIVENAFKLTTRDLDNYKRLLVEAYENGRYSYGMYRNLMTALNSFATYILNKKKQDGEIYYEGHTKRGINTNLTPYVLISEKDIISYLQDLSLRVKRHTFQVYSFYLKQALDEMLEMKKGGELSDYINVSKVFSEKRYIKGKHLYPTRRRRNTVEKRKLLLDKYREYENLKSVTLNDILDALTYLRILKTKISAKEARMTQRTFDEVRIATALLIFTGARSTELSDLLVRDVEFEEDYMFITRNKLSEDDIKHRTTIFPLHPFLKASLQSYIRKYRLYPENYLISSQYLDKKISYAFNPSTLNIETGYISINGRRYSAESSIITVRKFRKFWDNYAEANRMDFRVKNYLLGRRVGVDIEYYVSVLRNKKVFFNIQSEYFRVFGDLDKKLSPVIQEVFEIKI